MGRLVLLAFGLAVGFVVLFLVVSALEVPLLTDPGPWLAGGGGVAAWVGVGLLVADVLLPVPSSLVMTAHGALFGWPLGAALSLAGGVGAVALAFALGRRGGAFVARLVGADRAQVDAFLLRYGGLAIVASRPVPVLAETVALLAGTSSMGWGTALGAGALGNLAPALLYAVAGASATTFGGLVVFAAVLALAGLFFAVGRRAARRASASRG